MLPIKKILAPTDFSEPSFEGLKAADELTRHFSAEVWLVRLISRAMFIVQPPHGEESGAPG